MRIFSAEQIRRWDQATVEEQHVSPFELMERAAYTCVNWLVENGYLNKNIQIFCGTGNNGGDGLAMARILHHAGARITVHVLAGKASELNQQNRKMLEELLHVNVLDDPSHLPVVSPQDLLIDAIFGTGLKRPPEKLAAKLIDQLNGSGSTIISIDMPSGLFTDEPGDHHAITATHTLTFQQYKYSFFSSRSEKFIGSVHVMDIGLSRNFYEKENSRFQLLQQEEVGELIRYRKPFSHKGDHGHAALLAGSFGMMGACVLAAKGCLAAGAGKLTCYVPETGYNIIQSTVPAAMAKVFGKKRLRNVNFQPVHEAIGAGPGIGRYNHEKLLGDLLSSTAPLVLDADALNALSEKKSLLLKLPADSILTPHPGEFQRLFGTGSDPARTAVEMSERFQIFIVLKGRYTCIATPEGRGFFNSTGNPGMARGGMGDVLTGIITGLRAQGYSALHACLLGVYWHGLSADIAVQKLSVQTMQPEDVINYMGEAWKQMQGV